MALVAYNAIESEIEQMANRFNQSGFTQVRLIAGFSVELQAANRLFYIGDRYMTESGWKAVNWLFNNQAQEI